MDEPTLAQLDSGRILLVMRGSNDKRPELPSYRWHSFSTDGGRHWTDPSRGLLECIVSFHQSRHCAASTGAILAWEYYAGESARDRPRILL